MMHVGMIGLGAMGQGMARNLAQQKYLTHVWNRTPEKMFMLAKELNVTASSSLQQLAMQSHVMILCVSADEDVLDIIHAMRGNIQPDTIIVDTSTINSETAKKVARLLANQQVHYLDAPVSGGVEGAKKGILSMMVGGDAIILEKIRPILESMCARIIHIGDTGMGQGTKAVNQIMAAGINQAVTEALAFAQAENLPLNKVIDVVSGGAAGNWFLEHRGLTMTQNQYQSGFKLSLHQKDLKICTAMARNNSAQLPLVEQTICHYQQLIDAGLGDEDISALFRLKKKI